MRTRYNAIDEEVSALCITRTFAYACWLIRDFSDQSESTAPYFFPKSYYVYYVILYNARPRKNAAIA